MPTQMKPTKKNSPAIHHGMGKTNGPASEYAAPHTMSGKKITVQSFQSEMDAIPYGREKSVKDARITDPLSNGVSYGVSEEKTSGIEMRGAGAATKGRMSRGPMA